MNLTLIPLGMIGPWQIMVILVLPLLTALLVVALVQWTRMKASTSTKMLWLLVIVLAPILGSILFLILKKQFEGK